MSEQVERQLRIKQLGLADYTDVFEAMQQFTENRSPDTVDELWLVEHPPVYTQGTAGKAEHVLNPGNIPIVQVNRGGQVTYHGPGQVVIYFLLNIERRKLAVRKLVSHIEQAMINFLADNTVEAVNDPNAPGVYVSGAKIGSIGLRVTQGCTYHGLSLNVDMDLGPFQGINPCGYAGMPITQLKDLNVALNLKEAQYKLAEKLVSELEYLHIIWPSDAPE